MKIVNILIRVILILIVLFLVTRIFRRADENNFLSAKTLPVTKGNAPDSVRNKIVSQLLKFQDGYSLRDISKVDTFMTGLYSKDNIMILGTMPGELFIGFERAAGLVKSDWESWGDCKFDINNASISSNGNTAWFFTTGYVKLDLSRLLVLPLRLTGIMINDNGIWKFRQQQFQFNIDFSLTFLAVIILFIWLLVDLAIMANAIIKSLKIKKASFPSNN